MMWLVWNDKFPPLNLYNFPNKMISEIDIKDWKDMEYRQDMNYTHGQVFPNVEKTSEGNDDIRQRAEKVQRPEPSRPFAEDTKAIRRDDLDLKFSTKARYDGVGTKYDSNKTRLELVDSLAVEGLAEVLTFGAHKYAANNWRNGLHYSRVIGAMLRHVSAIQRGEDIDPESGLPHIDHVGCCWMFLSNFMKTRPDLDDRWKPKKHA